MKKSSLILTGFLLLFAIAACAPAAPTTEPLINTEAALLSTPSDTPSATPLPSATLTDTASPSATFTPAGPQIPDIMASTPGIAETLTAVYSTPGVQATRSAQQTQAAATLGAKMPGYSNSLLSQCPNPSDPPKPTWLDIPVMPQATAGQVVQTLLGSYYCYRAPETVPDVEAFYKQNLAPPNWMLQSDTNGSMIFVGFSQAGVQLLTLNSGPGNKNDLIVAINVTNPVGMPTQKP